MGTFKCLVADDDELVRSMISKYLDGIATCFMAENGSEAVKKFKAAQDEGAPFDVVIMDIMMPEMDGHAAGKEIRRLEKEQGLPLSKQVKIVVLSALNTPRDVMQSFMAAQSAAHLVKPVEPQKLRETLNKLGVRKN